MATGIAILDGNWWMLLDEEPLWPGSKLLTLSNGDVSCARDPALTGSYEGQGDNSLVMRLKRDDRLWAELTLRVLTGNEGAPVMPLNTLAGQSVEVGPDELFYTTATLLREGEHLDGLRADNAAVEQEREAA